MAPCGYCFRPLNDLLMCVFQVEKLEDGAPGKYRVTMKLGEGSERVEEYNTVMVAVGRDPCTQGMGLDKVGVQLNK